MTLARYRLVDTHTTPYYHCVSRCVRRAYLCGFDSLTGKNFDHRKQWILDRIKLLSSVFTVEVCAYAIMSNHFHLVLHVNTRDAEALSFDQVIDRWLILFKGPAVVQKFKTGSPLSSLELDAVTTWVEIWRERLKDRSWYMRCLNENIARQANAEEKCKGRFWEGRFRSQALLDEAAVVSCMAYVDLNPVRAKLSRTPEESEFTSIQERLQHFTSKTSQTTEPLWLKPLAGEKSHQSQSNLPLSQTDYFTLVDWTGQAIRRDKRGAIPTTIKPILQRLGVEQGNWVTNTQHFGSRFYRALGRVNQIRQLAKRSGQQWLKGQSQVSAFYR